jgi:hypothetical protein
MNTKKSFYTENTNSQKLILTFIIILFVQIANAQCDSSKLCYYKRDTMQYFNKVFVSKKSDWINKPIVGLISKIELKPYSFSFGNSKRIDSIFSFEIEFMPKHLINGMIFQKKKGSFYTVTLYLVHPLSSSIEENYNTQNRRNNSAFSYNTFKSKFGNLLIKDFKFERFEFNW